MERAIEDDEKTLYRDDVEVVASGTVPDETDVFGSEEGHAVCDRSWLRVQKLELRRGYRSNTRLCLGLWLLCELRVLNLSLLVILDLDWKTARSCGW